MFVIVVVSILFFILNIFALFYFFRHTFKELEKNHQITQEDKKNKTNTNAEPEQKNTKQNDHAFADNHKKYEAVNEYIENSDNNLDSGHALPLPMNMIPWSRNTIEKRDRAVLNDALYPPLNRNSLNYEDTYRLVGYLVNEESKSDSWKLFARSKNRNQAQFYASSIDNNIDMKIALTDDILRGKKLRDLYNLPEHVFIDHPLFSPTHYTVVENPYTDFSSVYI